jgi:hypothetical protein
VYYDGRMVIETEGKRRVRHLFSQRVGWHFGLIRVYVDRWRAVAGCSRQSFGFAYQFLVYVGIFVLLLHPLKLLGLPVTALSALNGLDALIRSDAIPDVALTNPVYFAGVYLKYAALMIGIVPLAVGRGSRARALAIAPAYPFYALFQVLPATVGYVNWLTLRLWGRRVYRDHYQPAAP